MKSILGTLSNFNKYNLLNRNDGIIVNKVTFLSVQKDLHWGNHSVYFLALSKVL